MTEQEATKEAIRQLECANTGKGLSIDWSDGKDILAVTVVLGEPAEAIIAALREKAERENPSALLRNVHVGLKTKYETPHVCGYCGEHIAEGWPFCPECGTPTKLEPKGAER